MEETGGRLWRTEKKDIRGRHSSGEAERNLSGSWEAAEFGQAEWRSGVAGVPVEAGWGQGLESPASGVIGIVP